MEGTKHISSTSNPLIKRTLLLKEKSRERKKTGLFTLEGFRELQLAYQANYVFETILYCDTIISEKDKAQLTAILDPSIFISVSTGVYQKIAQRTTTEGVIAIAKTKEHLLNNIIFRTENPLILVAEAPEKPGNIGALLRTADAANVDAVIIANPKTDIYNPNIIRSSVGCLFSRQIATASTEEILLFLKKQNLHIFCAALSASTDYTSVDFTEPTAIVVGTEDLGLSETWLNSATQNIIIPMEGKIDSLNVSVSAAILIFEAKRQRKKIV